MRFIGEKSNQNWVQIEAKWAITKILFQTFFNCSFYQTLTSTYFSWLLLFSVSAGYHVWCWVFEFALGRGGIWILNSINRLNRYNKTNEFHPSTHKLKYGNFRRKQNSFHPQYHQQWVSSNVFEQHDEMMVKFD